MTKFLWSAPVRALACPALMVSLVCLGLLSPAVAAGPASPQNGPQSGPKIWLGNSQALPVNFTGKGVAPLGAAQPVSMAQGDFDQDGIADLAVGYRAGGTGFIAIHRGNLDAFAPQSEESFQAIARGEFPAPFLPEAEIFSVPVIPDFIGAGNFTGTGHTDLIVAARGGNALYLLAGDGKGNFAAPKAVNLPGMVTGLAAGEFGNRALGTLLVGISASKKSSLVVLGGSPQGPVSLATFSLNAPASNFAFGDFGDPGFDAAFLSGGQVVILRSAPMQLSPVSLPGSAVSMALGSFLYDRNGGSQIALLTADGSVRIVVRNEFDPRLYTAEEFRAIRQARRNGQTPPLVPARSFPANGWKIAESFASLASVTPGQAPLFFRTRISSNSADDLMWLNAGNGLMVVISHPDSRPGAATFLPGQISIKPYLGSPVAGMPMRLNVDGRPGVIALHQGQTEPAMSMPLPDPTFTVNRTDDPTPASPITNACNGVANDCSLREAILRANALAGTDTVMVPAGTYTLTIAKAINDCTGNFGALSVNDSLNIVGAGQNTTIIQAGTASYNPGPANGVDMVMNVNEDLGTANCPVTDATASLSNLTLQNGHNRGTVANFDGDGGCMEFDTGTSGNSTLTLTNVTLQNCDTTDGNGAGLANFNSNNGAGMATISSSIIQGNSAVQITGGATGTGGGIWAADPSGISMSGSQVLNNLATNSGGSNAGSGGGITITSNSSNSRQTAIHGSTISGNTAAGLGGGLNITANTVIDQGTIISNNSGGTANITNLTDGGGIFMNVSANGCPGACTDTVTLNKVTITGNSAPNGRGGGIATGTVSGGGPLTMSFSRLAGNTAGTSGNNLENINSTVTATNNWWGTNAAATTIHTTAGTTTFDPFIVLTNTANPSLVNVNASTTLTASFLQDNHGTVISASNLDVVLGLPVTWGNAILGALSNEQTNIDATGCPAACAPSAGTATATFTAGSTSLPGPQPQAHADATVDNGTATADITIPLPPILIKAFGAASIPLNGTTSLTFTLQNNNTVALSSIAFSDNLPAGLIISTPNGLTGTCGGGTITATQATSLISLSGATLAASSSCTFSVNVNGTAAGLQNNTTGNVSAMESGTGGTASASLSVLAPPSIAKVFNPSSIGLNTTTSLTFTITNPAANADPLTGVAFTDTLPTGLTVANASATVCGGTLTTTNPTLISLTGATIAVNSQCQFSVTVTGGAVGQYTNTTGNVTSTNGGTGNTASANLTVALPPTITKAFGAASIPLNGATTLTFNINNPNTNVTLTGLAFTDNLPSGLVVASTPNASNTCGGTFTAVGGAGSMNLSGGTLAPSASCTVAVSIQGTTPGVKNNSVQITSTEGGTGNTSTASITVVAPPVIIKAFGAASIPLNGSTSLTFTIQNNNTGTALSGVGFSDTLPAGLVVATPNGLSGSCGGGTITATAGTNVVSLSGATLAASSSCTFSINVTGTAAGLKNNTTGNVTSTEGGTGGTASASIAVVAPPLIAKAFLLGGIQPNGVSSLTITISDPPANSVDELGVAFSDFFPANLVVATPNGLTNTCGGTPTATSGSGSVSLSGGSVAVNSSCTVTVNVTSSFTGSYVNTTGPVSSTNGGTGGSASATLFVANPPTISKLFLPATVAQDVSTLLSFTISNPNSNSTPPNNDVTLTGITFTDALPPGLQIASPNNLSNDCGGTVTAVPGSTSLTLTGGVLDPAVGLRPARRAASPGRLGPLVASGSCFISLLVTPTAAGTLSNTTGPISANESGPGATSNTASLTVTPGPTVVAPTLVKTFNPADIAVGQNTALIFTVTNPNASTPLVNIAFTDALPSGLVVSSPNGLAGTCVANNGAAIAANPGSGSVTLVSLNLAANSSCSFSVSVTGITFGAKTNVTGAISAMFDSGSGTFLTVTGGPASASMTVEAPVMALTKSHSGTFSRGQTGANYTITVSNTGAGNTVGTVTVVDTLPGVPNTLVPTAVSGTGWTCDLPSLTCTRGDALPAGTSYPPITLTVNIPQNIVNHFVNTATVSGGGDPNNHTASDGITLVGKPILITSTDSGAVTIVPGMQATFNFDVDATALNPPPAVLSFTCGGLPKGTACIFSQLATGQAFSQLTLTVTSLGRGNLTPAPPFDTGKPPIYTALLLSFLALMGVSLAGRRGRRSRLRLAMALMALMVLMALWGCGGNPLVTPPGTYTITVTATEDPASGNASGSTTVQLHVL